MIFSDGSAPRSRMRRPETCRWEIRGSPRFWPTASSGSGRSSELVLQLPFVDLRGARVNVTDADGARLWTCDACTDAPPAIVTVTDVLHVTFEVVDMPADPRLFVGDDDLAVVPEDAVLVEEGAADGDPDEYAVPGRMSDADYAAYVKEDRCRCCCHYCRCPRAALAATPFHAYYARAGDYCYYYY